ncbi:MAG TPA: glycoside hydrolase family 125 protein [Candidatus Dormibacteraeota bacterium]|nr:glycoside hydrolase family 125 protein [Candidatus Dormibacteraeota bacterium]
MLQPARYQSVLLCVAAFGCIAATSASDVATLSAIYSHAADSAYSRHAILERDGTTYISSGDINMEWLRDSSAVLVAYVPDAATKPAVRSMIKGAIARQARYILIDPYANAFTEDYRVAERKFEVDSLLYPVQLAYRYWREDHDGSIFTPQLGRAFALVLRVLRTEQHHATRSHYRNGSLVGGDDGMPFSYTGMIWTGFRPSDDAAQYPYNIPQNMFAVVELQQLSSIERSCYHNERLAEEAWGLSVQVHDAIERSGVVFVPHYGRIYAYEVDGLGHANLMDDANVPSLLSAPYIGYLDVRDPIYQATRRFVLSPSDPYFYSGKDAQGIGSAHTPRGYVWPLALIVEAMTSIDPVEKARVLGYLAASDTGNHVLHESFDPNDPKHYTRADFAWPNALFTELGDPGPATGRASNR